MGREDGLGCACVRDERAVFTACLLENEAPFCLPCLVKEGAQSDTKTGEEKQGGEEVERILTF